MGSGIGIGISSVFGGPRGLPSDFSYGKKQFCDDDNSTYTPTPVNAGGTWSISPALSGFNTSTGAFSPYGVTGTFVVSHTFDGKTSTQTIVLNDSDVVATFTYPFSSYPQSGANPSPTITGSGPGINTGTFSATPAGLSINAATGEIDLSESSLNSYVITYTSGSEFCADTATFALEVEDPYVGFKFRILVPAGADQTLTLETVNGSSAAPNSVINWGDGTGVQALTTATASNSFPTGTYDIEINAFNSVAPVNNFSVTAGETLVTQVIDWGGTPWSSLSQAFKDCTNLTTFGTGTFKGITGGVDLTSCFQDCTSLTSIDMRNWDLSNGSTMELFAKGCLLVENVSLPALTPISGKWSNAFELVGSSITDGCDFQLNGLNFTGTTATGNNYSLENFFKQVKIKPSSKFTNWVFNAASNQQDDLLKDFFINSVVTGSNSTLDVSGWTNCNSKVFQSMFEGINLSLPLVTRNTNLTIDVTGLNVSSGTNFREMFARCMTSNITGLNSWSAPDDSSVGINYFEFMKSANHLKLTSSDNLSNEFMSVNSSTAGNMFFGLGKELTSAEGYGVAPNLASLDFSVYNFSALSNMFRDTRFSSNVDFTNVTFSTTVGSTSNMFNNSVYSNSDSEIKLSGIGTVITNSLSGFATGSRVRKITLENGKIDTTLMTNFGGAFNGIYGDEDQLATVEITLPSPDAAGSWNGFSFAATTSFSNTFAGTFGPGSGATPSLFKPISTCQMNNFIRVLRATQSTPLADADIKFIATPYSGPQALVSGLVDDLRANGWEILNATGVDSISEAPYFTLSSYSLVTGSESTATINASYTGGTFTSSNTAIATVNASTGTVTTGVNTGTCQIRYTLADGTCYNEVDLAVAIPLIANNFSFNFDGADNFLSVDNSLVEDDFINVPYLTFSSWFYGNNIPTAAFRALFTNIQYGSGKAGFALVIPGGESDFNIRYHGSTATKDFNTGIAIPGNQWNHISVTVASRDTTPASGILTFYLNGIAATSTTNDLASGLSYPASGRVSGTGTNIGSNAYQSIPGNGPWNGKIDEVAIWNIALSGPQILDIYNGRLGVQNETVDLSKYANLGGNLVYWNRMGD